MQDQPTFQQPQLSRGGQYTGPTSQVAGNRQPQAAQQHGQVAQQPQQFADVQSPQQSAMEPQAQQPQFQVGQQQQQPPQQQLAGGQQPPQQAASAHVAQQPGAVQQPEFQRAKPESQIQGTIQQPEIRRQAVAGQSQIGQQLQPQSELQQQQQPQALPQKSQLRQQPQSQVAQQQQPAGSVASWTGVRQQPVVGFGGEQGAMQSQQIPFNSLSEQGQAVGGQLGQQITGQEPVRQYVETADTKLLADTLARRLGLTSQQLAQVVPQLGVALGSQQYSAQQPIGQEAGIKQPIGQQASMGVEQPVTQPQSPVTRPR
jgi:hypothetical protein